MSRLVSLARDQAGSVMVEFTVVFWLLLLLTMGLAEFSYALFQWNSAAKAVHAGARLAAVSAPVAGSLKSYTGLSETILPGDPMPQFECVCSGAGSGSCTGGDICGAYSLPAMKTLLYGRGTNEVCGTVDSAQLPGMCDLFDRVEAQHIRVTYKQTGLGFAGRPGGPVPTITVELTGLTFNFILLQFLPGFTSISIPSMRTTITGEDLSITN